MIIPGGAAGAGVVVDGIIRHGAAKGDEVPGDEAAKGQDLGGRQGFALALELQVFTATADGDRDGYEVGDPRPALPEVESLEAEQRDGEGDETGDDDADVDVNFARVQHREGLAADDGGEEREAGQGGGVQEEGNGNEVEAGDESVSNRG